MGYLLVIGLWVLYLALTANLAWNNLSLGLILALGLSLLLRPDWGRPELKRLPRALIASVRYLFLVMYDVISSGVTVARMILDPRLPVDPAILAIPSGCSSETATALSAHAISLAPGELVVKIGEQGTLYVHVLDVGRAQLYQTQAQRLREDMLRDILP